MHTFNISEKYIKHKNLLIMIKKKNLFVILMFNL